MKKLKHIPSRPTIYSIDDYISDVYFHSGGYALADNLSRESYRYLIEEANRKSTKEERIAAYSYAKSHARIESLGMMPLYLRCLYLIDILESAEAVQGNKLTNARITNINEILSKPSLDIYMDYNIPYMKLESKEELVLLKTHLESAITNPFKNISFRVHTCKKCGHKFYLSWQEINYYRHKNLELPKRCKCCIEAEKISKAEKMSFADAFDEAQVRNNAIRMDTILKEDFNNILSRYRTKKIEETNKKEK